MHLSAVWHCQGKCVFLSAPAQIHPREVFMRQLVPAASASQPNADCATGVPMPNANTHCPKHANATSCYLLNTTLDTYANHKANCARRQGYLVSFTSAFEHLDVITQLPSLAPATASGYYWIGLEKAGSVWYWADGGSHGS
jgi:hypothetical protein